MSSEEQDRFSAERYGTDNDRSAAGSDAHQLHSTPLVQGRHVDASSYSHSSHATNDTHAAHLRGGELDEMDHAASRADGVEYYVSKRKKAKRSHRVLKVVVITLVAVLAVAGAAFAWYINNINSKLSKGIDSNLLNQLVATTKTDDPFYMLLLGVDQDDERTQEWGADQSNYRTDSIILVRVDPPNKKVTLISIPRDTMVDMDDHGTQKINAAYSFGGASYMVEQVSKLAGVNISHYAELNFEQFTSIVDTLGGIEVTLPVAVSDMEYSDIDLPAGTQTLDGQQALGLCRSRHAYDAYGGGDYYRSANQRMVIAAIIRKVLDSDPTSWPGLISQLADSVTTDLSATDILSLANQFKDFDTENDIYSGSVPTTSTYTNNLWYEVVDENAWKTMMQRTDAGEPPYSDSSQDFTAGVAGSVSSGTGSSDSSESSSTSSEPIYSGSVLVLNGTPTQGLASSAANVLTQAGYSTIAGNADSTSHTTTTIVYNTSKTSSAQDEARGVVEKLGLSVTPVENPGTYSDNYDVVVVLGTDYKSK
ncbi:MAG: LCP family protein [Olsenella sp.]|jgi:LCP family protein required for cell wall assembly|nr:LCP family protein [Olsenella sp.]MCI2123984.1 LCP family protein [Olsenella sp.]MCI2159181.1 LCP family protein [Olsenella sp.]MCI2184406.1 LCP family protein [Olsenella sp.]MCI2187454.1 LCP family protein [Olsenella sp.]